MSGQWVEVEVVVSDDMRIVGEETVDDEVVVESVGEVDEGVLAVGRGHVNRETGEERLLVEVDFILQREGEKKMVRLKTNHTVRGQRIFFTSALLFFIFSPKTQHRFLTVTPQIYFIHGQQICGLIKRP